MATTHLELPTELLEVANLDAAHLTEKAARLLALEFYREERISIGRAAELCLMPLEAFMEFAVEHGVPVIRYTEEDWELDRRNLPDVQPNGGF